MIFYALITIAGFVYLTCYAIVCWKLKSWINCFSIYFSGIIGFDVVFGCISLMINGPSGSLRSYLYIYLSQMGCAIVIMATVLLLKGPRIDWYPRFHTGKIKYFPWIILGLGILMYLPIMIQYHQSLLTPRRIYEATRTGSGLDYFGSLVLINVAFLIYLFKKNRSRFETVVFMLLTALCLYEHGSKGGFLEPMLIFVIYFVHVRRKRIGFMSALGVVSLLIAFVSISFIATMSYLKTPTDLLYAMTNFADINRNTMLVIDSPMREAPFMGKLMLESELYARVPRAFFPNKPKTYGYFVLPAFYQNANYSGDQGASAFTNLGYLYADFGPFSVIVVLLESGLSAYFSIGLLRRLGHLPTPGLLILLCFLNGASVLPILIFILPETLIIALLVDMFSSGGYLATAI